MSQARKLALSSWPGLVVAGLAQSDLTASGDGMTFQLSLGHRTAPRGLRPRGAVSAFGHRASRRGWSRPAPRVAVGLGPALRAGLRLSPSSAALAATCGARCGLGLAPPAAAGLDPAPRSAARPRPRASCRSQPAPRPPQPPRPASRPRLASPSASCPGEPPHPRLHQPRGVLPQVARLACERRQAERPVLRRHRQCPRLVPRGC